MRPAAGRLPNFGVVLHRGRTTGRPYRTPVNVFPDRGGFVIALTYGREVDWLKNVIAAGECRLLHRGRTVELARPRIEPLRRRARAFPAAARAMLQILRVEEALVLDPAQPGAGRGRPEVTSVPPQA